MNPLSSPPDDRSPRPPTATAVRPDKKRYVAPTFDRHDRMPDVTGNSTITFPPFP